MEGISRQQLKDREEQLAAELTQSTDHVKHVIGALNECRFMISLLDKEPEEDKLRAVEGTD